ncbi:MAG: hypothetical protein U0359_26700 [Byssovorax sp.]
MKRALPVVLSLASLSACAGGAPAVGPPPRATPTGALSQRALSPGAAPPAAHAPAAPYRYRATVGEGARELTIEAEIPPTCTDELRLDQGTEPFLRDVKVSTGGPFIPLAVATSADGERALRLPPCPPEGCRLRYRFALGEAADALGTLGAAARHRALLLSPPSAWLLHPVDPPPGEPFSLEVATPPGLSFATGLFRAGGSGADRVDRYGADLSDLSRAPYSAFGALRVLTLDVAGQEIQVAFAPGAFAAGDGALLTWVEKNAQIVADYCGRAPLRRALVLLLPEEGHGITYARVLGNGGASIVVPLGERTSAEELDGSWELLHEMLHTAFPNLSSAHAWLEEGMATYLEPLLRARRGLISAEEAFHRLSRRMDEGLPAPGDRGLDHTPTWGRTYWGGALFCLLADLEIREKSGGARSLDDAIRAIVAAGGNVSDRWPIEQVIAAGDRGTGLTVLADLHAKMGSAPVMIDLPALWKKLGVIPGPTGARFDDGAPLAPLRKAMVAQR